jgi:hypothetical protein
LFTNNSCFGIPLNKGFGFEKMLQFVCVNKQVLQINVSLNIRFVKVMLLCEVCLKIATNVQGLAKFGHLLLCPPGTAFATRRNIEFSYGDQG